MRSSPRPHGTAASRAERVGVSGTVPLPRFRVT
jgi:hypothetical protein